MAHDISNEDATVKERATSLRLRFPYGTMRQPTPVPAPSRRRLLEFVRQALPYFKYLGTSVQLSAPASLNAISEDVMAATTAFLALEQLK